MKVFKQFLFFCSVGLMFSCGVSIPDSVILEASGDDIEYVSNKDVMIEKDSYTLYAQKQNSKTWKLLLRLKMTKKTLSQLKSLTGIPVLQLLDENRQLIDGGEMKLGENSLEVNPQEKLHNFLGSSDSGQILICFYLFNDNEEQISQIMNNAKFFLIKGLNPDKSNSGGVTSAETTGLSSVEDEDSSASGSEETSSSAGSVDFEELLDSYDKYVTEYISFMKKASEGDMSALTEYPKMMERANDLSEKIEKCKGEMSLSQLERYNKITMRMAEAAKQMQKKH